MAKQTNQVPEIDIYLEAVHRSAGPHAYVSLLGLKAFDTASLHAKVKRGLPFGSFERLIRMMELPMLKAAEILFIPPRTLQRRKARGRLQPDESDRLLRLSRIYGKAIELFEGDNSAALRWLRSPVEALGRATPLAMSQTEPGSREVERLIGRLEHGVFS
jgi:putative toxin-antitoxin system antitoxin component (TIGR02293 family)